MPYSANRSPKKTKRSSGWKWAQILVLVVLGGGGTGYTLLNLLEASFQERCIHYFKAFQAKVKEFNSDLPIRWEPESCIFSRNGLYGFTLTIQPSRTPGTLPVKCTLHASLFSWLLFKKVTGKVELLPSKEISVYGKMLAPFVPTPITDLPIFFSVSLGKDPQILSVKIELPSHSTANTNFFYFRYKAKNSLSSKDFLEIQGSIDMVRMLKTFFPIIGPMIQGATPLGAMIADALGRDLPAMNPQYGSIRVKCNGHVDLKFSNESGMKWDITDLENGILEVSAFENPIVTITFQDSAVPNANPIPIVVGKDVKFGKNARYVSGTVDYSGLLNGLKNLTDSMGEELCSLPILAHLPLTMRQSLALLVGQSVYLLKHSSDPGGIDPMLTHVPFFLMFEDETLSEAIPSFFSTLVSKLHALILGFSAPAPSAQAPSATPTKPPKSP